MPVRSANAQWDGTLKEGKGRIAFADFDKAYSFNSRFAEGTGTNPEELIAASIAGCYSMALAGDLGGAGFTPGSVRTIARVRVDPNAGGFTITGITLDTEASVPGLASDAFLKIAEGTKQNCPVSRALKAVPITLNARLV